MEPQEHQIVRALYHALGELPEDQWREILAKADLAPVVRNELEALLGHESSAGLFSEQRMGSAGIQLLAEAAPEDGGTRGTPLPDLAPGADLAVGRVVGGFRIEGVLGRGGMGVVYRASQEQPRREVALKVIRALDFDGVARRRFEYEAEILARMDHPCVAKIYQAGIDRSSSEGTPYIAMELVSGDDLFEHFERTGGALEERLRVFELVCSGVEHAHQRGVVHRDLKPANILVSADGRPRILDFGIARPLHDGELSTPGRTQPGALLGSLAWMSPEQARGELEQIDVRSDVYSLGLILFRLLSGGMPYEVGGLEPWRAAQVICETEPKRLGRIRPELRGDLELIAAMALEKEPDRRYPSAGALAKDVRRFLEDQPIEARPWSVSYQLRKFARRHRLLVGAALALFLTVAVGFASGLYLWRRSERALATAKTEALTSQRVERFLLDTFAEENPYEEDSGAASGERRTVKEMLDRASATIGDELAGEPTVRARLMEDMGQIYSALGQWDAAARLLEGALAVWRDELGPAEPETLRTELLLGTVYLRADRLDDSEAMLRAALDGRRAALGAASPETLEVSVQLGTLYGSQGRFEEAEELLDETLALRRPTDAQGIVDTSVALGDLYMEQGRYEEAEARFREAMERNRELRGLEHPETLLATANLAAAIMRQDRNDEALSILSGVLEVARRVLGENHVYVLRTLHNMGEAHLRADRLDEAEALFREILARPAEVLEANPGQRVATLANLSSVCMRTGRLEEAEQSYLTCLETAERLWGPEHLRTLTLEQNLGTVYVRMGRDEEALPIFERSVATGHRVLGEEHPSQRQFRANRDAALERALTRARRDFGSEDPRTLALLLESADDRRADGDVDGAEKRYFELLDACAGTTDAEASARNSGLEGLARLYLDAGRLEEAASFASELLDATPAKDPEHASRAELLERIQAALDERGD